MLAAVVVVAVRLSGHGGRQSASSTTTVPPIGPGPSTAPSPSGGRDWWVPPLGNQPWQWVLSHPLSLTSAEDMGRGATLPTGKPAPDPVIYDIDGFDNPASTVAALHADGFHVVCYIEVGAAEDYRPDYKEFPSAALGKRLSGYPEERYLDIRNPTVVSIIEARIQMCADKGFDAVETDIDDSYGSDSGFPLTLAIEERYMTNLANYMHGLGLGWWIKNPDDNGDSYAADMYPVADAVLTEQCNQYDTCSLLSAYQGHKAVFNAEYQLRPSEFCPADDRAGFNGVQFNVNLNGPRHPCR